MGMPVINPELGTKFEQLRIFFGISAKDEIVEEDIALIFAERAKPFTDILQIDHHRDPNGLLMR